MRQQDLESIDQFTTFSRSHAFQFLQQMVAIELAVTPGTQQFRLLLGPSKEVLFVMRGGHQIDTIKLNHHNCSLPHCFAIHGTWIPAISAGMTRWKPNEPTP